MSEETEEVEAKASELGWVQKEQFRGDPEKWVDAAEFVRRGEQMMPILQANNRKLLGEVSTLRGELTETKTLLKSATESIESLKEFNTEMTRKAVREEQSKLRRELAEARKNGDTDLEVEIEEKLDEAKESLKTAETEKVNKETKPEVTGKSLLDDPSSQLWMQENPWFGTDKRRTAVAVGIAQELRSDPANAGLLGRAFLEKVAAEVDSTLGTVPNQRRQAASKVGEGRGSENSGGGGSGKGKSYDDLPADAKATCDRQGNRLVGKGRAFADVKAWRAHYANEYFSE